MNLAVKKKKGQNRKEQGDKKKNANRIIYSWFARETTSGKAAIHLHTAANSKKNKTKQKRKIPVHYRDHRSCDIYTQSAVRNTLNTAEPTHRAPGDCWVPPLKPYLSTWFSSRSGVYHLLVPFSVSLSPTPGESSLLTCPLLAIQSTLSCTDTEEFTTPLNVTASCRVTPPRWKLDLIP